MNLTGRSVYQKTQRKRTNKRNTATPRERMYWRLVAEAGCVVAGNTPCGGRITIHHCFTGAGGRKDHAQVVGLCWAHHLGPEGIDGKKMSKKDWQTKYGSETVLLRKLERLLRKVSHG